jgi:CheY-like chemotaxis protein
VRLAQVFSNLFDNAVKYSPPGGVVHVDVEERGSFLVVTVQDEGRGIRSEHLPHVFDLFYQADRSLGRPHEGLGIGLTLVKRIVELHGGAIEAESEGLGRGSRFSVRLPLVRERADTSAPAVAPAPPPMSTPPLPDAPEPTAERTPAVPQPAGTAGAGGWRFLIADDNQDSADSMAILLRMSGHDVQVAYDGEEAVRIAELFAPQIALLDIGMPRLNGHEVAQALRGRPGGRDVILIAATGWGQEEDRRRSLETGFDAHLVKPVDHEALLRLVAELVPLR